MRATLSFDLDNQWSYMKIHGDREWEEYPTFLPLVVPRALAVFDDLGVKITVFVVGKDAAMEQNSDAIRSIAQAAHEIGNHSYHHESWLHLYNNDQLETEFDLSEEHIERATGVRTLGFRGPGYSLSEGVLKILHRRGYLYDASTLPTFFGPAARAYYFMKSGLNAEEREKRKLLFGSFRDGFRSVTPYYWKVDNALLAEVPVTTFPFLRIPFHLSYIVYISTFSRTLAKMYWRSALHTCKIFGVEPSILLHPLDFVGEADLRSLRFFPGMQMPAEVKIDFVRECLQELTNAFEVIPLGQFVKSFGLNGKIPTAVPIFHDIPSISRTSEGPASET